MERNGILDDKSINEILDRELHPIHAIDPVIRMFILVYATVRHVGDAAKAAGITKHQGNKLLNRKDIADAIKAIGVASARKYGFDASEVIARVNDVVQVDPADIVNPDGTVKEMHEIPPDVRKAIKSFKVEETWDTDLNGVRVQTGRVVDITFWDKLKAAELLGRQEGLFKQVVEHKHELGANASKVLLGAVELAEKRLEAQKALPEPRDVSGSGDT